MPERTAVVVDCDFPGGNIIVDGIEGDTISVRQDLRDTEGHWFYWCFRVLGAAGRKLTVRFTDKNVIGVYGPAVSTDGGWNWRWLGAESVEGQSFTYRVPDDAGEVRFSMGMPYLQAHLEAFLARYAGHPNLEAGTLCATEQGRQAELLRLGRLDGGGEHRILLTCRHHCCEMMASYSLEGIMEAALAQTELGEWYRRHAELVVVPFVDKDGVENGDQGKNRRPRDHNRDYAGDSLYATTRAIREMVSRWTDERLRFSLDLHCPSLRGRYHEAVHFTGGPSAENWRRVERFCEILRQVQEGPLVFDLADNLPWGKDWNVPSSFEKGKGCAKWMEERSGILIGTSIEIPYANANGQVVTAEAARALGHDLARAIRGFLSEA